MFWDLLYLKENVVKIGAPQLAPTGKLLLLTVGSPTSRSDLARGYLLVFSQAFVKVMV